jgi:small subunit ribosomal protein S11
MHQKIKLTMESFSRKIKNNKNSTLRHLQRHKRMKKSIFGFIYVNCTLNNTIVTLTDVQGNTKVTASSGTLGHKGAKRSTIYAAREVGEHVGNLARKKRYYKVQVILKGLGFGKRSCLKGLKATGLMIPRLEDRTPLPHNGCRAPKKRRM